jgi:signal transduction histidine kinase
LTDSVKKKRKRRSSLLWKHIVVIFVALIIGFAAFFALSPLFRYVIEREYMTEDKEQARVEQLLANFKNYVEQNQISSTDMEAINDWVKSNDNFKLIMLEGVESDTVPDTQKYDYSVEVNFTDKSVLVAVQDYSEVLFLLGDVLAVGVSIVLFILVVIVYYQAEISRIMRLSRDVKAIAGGDLQGRIGKMGNDEIAQLADHVDGMRDSILQKMEEKEQAWRANQDLITSISHDIRTPLTALLGYLELLEMQDANLTEEQKKYLEVASENAGRIKRQSDDLFNYFLAYGHRTEEISMQSYRADVLFEQLLGERFTPADLANQSFACNISAELAGVQVQTNVDYLVRVLDNLYSNIVKYADRDYPVELNVALRGKMAVITVQNRIAPVTPGVESTKLGLLTCESIMERLHGSFRTENDGSTFTVVIALPIKETK